MVAKEPMRPTCTFRGVADPRTVDTGVGASWQMGASGQFWPCSRYAGLVRAERLGVGAADVGGHQAGGDARGRQLAACPLARIARNEPHQPRCCQGPGSPACPAWLAPGTPSPWAAAATSAAACRVHHAHHSFDMAGSLEG